MMDSVKSNISSGLFALKSEMGGLVELMENWILSLKGEEERRVRIQGLNTILSRSGAALPPADRAACREHLEALLSQSELMMFSSVTYREKLQALFKSQIDKVNGRLDQMFAEVGKLLEQFEKPAPSDDPAGGIIIAQEEERKRISREIHDGPAQTLAALTMRIDYCLELVGQPDQLKTELGELKSSIIRSLKDIRRFIFDLRPMAIDDLGLIPTLEQFISGCKDRTNASFHLTIEGERSSLPPERELAVFRVIQEAVNNSIRHADARSIQIHLAFEEDPRSLAGVVKDDGKGFNVPDLRKVYASLKRLGLVSMEERIRLAGGTFDLVSTAGGGTVVSFRVPR